MKWLRVDILALFYRFKFNLYDLERYFRTERTIVNSRGGGKTPRRKINKSSWHPLPNIEKFKITLAPHDWLFLLFGLYRRFSSSQEFWNWKNAKANRYVAYMFKRLNTQVRYGRYTDAETTFWLLMNSSAYQTIALNKVLKGWYKTMKWSKVKRVLKRVKYLSKNRVTDIDFKRVYIDKGQGKWRPLGVPSAEWRIYLHMLNCLITEWRSVSEGNYQHAFLPGRGVISAWAQLFPLLQSERNIYEADFESFFDSIKHSAIKRELQNLCFSPSMIQFFDKLNKSIPDLMGRDKDKIIERDRLISFKPGLKPNPANSEVLSKLEHQNRMQNFYQNINKVSFNEVKGNGKYFQPIKLHSRILKQEGVPQGAATSCSLSTLALRYLEIPIITHGYNPETEGYYPFVLPIKVLLYADDIIVFPQQGKDLNGVPVNWLPIQDPRQLIEDKLSGIKVNTSKSRWIKENGEWKVEYIKFLGFKYFPAKTTFVKSLYSYLDRSLLYLLLDVVSGLPIFSIAWSALAFRGSWVSSRAIFQASTRNGATLRFSSREMFLSYLNNARTFALNSSASHFLNGESLESWVLTKAEKFMRLHNPLSLLFSSSMDKYKAPNYVPHISITGWLFARMQSNSWDIHFDQDFKLRWVKGSWISLQWQGYALRQNLSIKCLTTFNASSFACHYLLDFAKTLKDKPRIVRVSV